MNRAGWLEKLINENNYTKGIELGVQDGNTYKYLVSNCPKLRLWGVDIWAEKDVRQHGDTGLLRMAQEKNNYVALQAYIRVNNFQNRAKLIRDFTHNCSDQFTDGYFDFIFVDASHTYDDVKKDIELWAPKVRKGGCISGHDINMDSVKRAVSESVTDYETTVDNVWYKMV